MKYIRLIIFGLVFVALNCFAQQPPKIFLNCSQARCYDDFVRTELSFFDFVRDMAEADIQIMFQTQGTGAGGRKYFVNFIGQKQFENIKDTLVFTVKPAETEDMIRKQILKTIKQGMVRYLLDNELLNQISINFPKQKNQELIIKKDPWHSWVFGLGGNGSNSGESNRRNLNLSGNFRASKITAESKFSFYSYYNQRNNRVNVDSTWKAVKIFDYGLNSIFVKSFSEHWSAGGFYKGFHSVYQNVDFSQSLAPALEYSIFPVSDFTRRQLRCIYQAGVRNVDYIEITVFDKTKETLPYHQVTGIFGVTEPWGSFSAEVNTYQYLHDLEKYRLSLELDFNWRIFEGLSVRFSGYASQVKNQISLAKSSVDASNILLGGRQLPTTFSYNTSFGINYTFGSINNSVVNPRFSGVE